MQSHCSSAESGEIQPAAETSHLAEDNILTMDEPEEDDEEVVIGDGEPNGEAKIKQNAAGPEDGEEAAARDTQAPAWAPFIYYRAGKEVHYYVGQEITIQESLDSFAGMIWPAALTLCHYLETHHKEMNLVDKAVLEIGAGTGLVSVVATLLGAWVTATDLPDVLSNLRTNLCRNTRGHCRHTPQVAALSWGYDLEDTYPRSVYRYDYVLAADVVYYHDFLKELLATMRHFCQAGTTLIWANKVRFETDRSFTENFKTTFHTRLLLEDGDVKLFMATRREASGNMDLLGGAQGEVVEEQREEGQAEGKGGGEEEEMINGERCVEEVEVCGQVTRECVGMQQQDWMKQTLQSNSQGEKWREEHHNQSNYDDKANVAVEVEKVAEDTPDNQDMGVKHDDEHDGEDDYDEKGEERCSLSPEELDNEGQADDREDETEDIGALRCGADEDDDLEEDDKKPAWVPNIFSRNTKDIYYYAGHEISIQEYIDSYGAVMWPAALALCSFLDTNRQRVNLLDKKVLELGSGTGLVAIVASLLGASVTATDLPGILGNLRFNVMRNTKARSRYPPKVEELSWGYNFNRIYPTSLYRYDYVLAADVVYHHDFLDELLVTMKHFCQPGTTLIWANKVRFETDWTFIENFRRTFHTTVLNDGEIKIFMATCK